MSFENTVINIHYFLIRKQLKQMQREIELCQWITKAKTRCTRHAKADGYCTQHSRMANQQYALIRGAEVEGQRNRDGNGNAPVAVAPAPKPTRPTRRQKMQKTETFKTTNPDPYQNLPIHPDQPHECFICLETVSRADDALFDCSYYVTGKGACVIHHECGKKMRKLECPGCRCPITTFRKISREVIEPRCLEDEQDRLRENARLPGFAELAAILFARAGGGFGGFGRVGEGLGAAILEEEENDEPLPPFHRHQIDPDELLTFALEFLPTMVDKRLLHEEMHQKYVYANCDEIDVAISGAREILRGED